MADWIIRRAVLADADDLASCLDAAYARYAAQIPDLPPVSTDCAEEISQHQVWVAEVGGDIIAGLVLMPEEGAMLVANVAVHPDYAGKGLGRALMDLADREAADQGHRELRLATHARMPENVEYYTWLGWQVVDRTENKVSMRKVI